MPAIIALINNDLPATSDIVEGTSRINISAPSTSVNPSEGTNARSATIALLSLLLTQSHTALSSINQELDLLRSAAMSAHIEAEDHERVERERKTAQRKQEGERGLKEDEMWRLDAPLRFGASRGKVAELIDDRGKVRPSFSLYSPSP